MNMNIDKLMETKEGVQLMSATLITQRIEDVTQQIYRRKKQLNRFLEYQAEGIDNADTRVENIKTKIQELNKEIITLTENLLALYK